MIKITFPISLFLSWACLFVIMNDLSSFALDDHIFYSSEENNICVLREKEIVIQNEVLEKKEKQKECNFKYKNEIKKAKVIIKKYWKLSYDEIYNLLSKDYKERLRRVNKIQNAEEYKEGFPVTERVWYKQVYQEAKVQNDKIIQISVLAYWEEEGYEGVTTYIFEMIKEKDDWKIENIIY